jgi:hypothetical protein
MQQARIFFFGIGYLQVYQCFAERNDFLPALNEQCWRQYAVSDDQQSDLVVFQGIYNCGLPKYGFPNNGE